MSLPSDNNNIDALSLAAYAVAPAAEGEGEVYTDGIDATVVETPAEWEQPLGVDVVDAAGVPALPPMVDEKTRVPQEETWKKRIAGEWFWL